MHFIIYFSGELVMSSERKHIRSKIQALAEAGVGIKEIAKRLDVS
jgi:hypothetical protein